MFESNLMVSFFVNILKVEHDKQQSSSKAALSLPIVSISLT